jgi:hypothetical protein
VAEPLLWGRGKGCAYVTERCVGGADGPLDGFCDANGATGCTADRRAQGVCNLVTYTSDLPAAYQYFPGQPNVGGRLDEADYCPVRLLVGSCWGVWWWV